MVTERVFFKLEYTVIELSAKLEITYGGPHEVTVVLRAPSAEEIKVGHDSRNTFCIASSSRKVSDQNRGTFEKILANQIIATSEIPGGGLEYKNSDGRIIRIPSLSEFPQPFRSFIEAVSADLRLFVVRTVDTLRWRTNVGYGSHNPFSSRGLHWSVDEVFWHPGPLDLRVHVEALTPPRISPAIVEDVKKLVLNDQSEPLHHNLYREAQEQLFRNPRSALVIGVGAAELAIKACISTLVPDAEWLAMNLPTPPLIKILTEYLPKLKARCTFDGKVKPPPASVLAALRKGVTLRNAVTHAGAPIPSIDTVDEILKAVRELLWLLDYYSGFEWALKYLNADLRSELMRK